MPDTTEARQWWWLSAEPGAVLAGPLTEAEAEHRWAVLRVQFPNQGIWRGPDADHVQPAQPRWATVRQPEIITEDVAGLSGAQLADALLALPGMRPGYRAAVLAEAATRLRGT